VRLNLWQYVSVNVVGHLKELVYREIPRDGPSISVC